MIANNNSQLSQEIRDVLKLQAGRDQFPQLAENKIVPVIDVNPKHAREINRIEDGTNTTASSTATIFTTSTTKKTLLHAVSIAWAADAVNTSTELSASFYPKGKAIHKIRLRKLSTVAGTGSLYADFPCPIELEPNTICGAIIQNGANAVCELSVTFFCQEIDNTGA